MPRLAPLALVAVALTACDSEKVSWAFVSNPSGDQTGSGGGIIVIIRSSSLRTGDGDRSLVEEGVQAGGAVTVRLATTADLAMIERRDGVELRCPSLPRGAVVAGGGSAFELPRSATLWEIDVPDAGDVHAAATGRGRLLVAEFGDVVVLEHQGGLIVFGTGDPDGEQVPPGWRVDPTLGPYLALTHATEPVRELRGSAPPPLEQRLQWDSARRSLRILGPRRQLLAEVPQHAVTLSGAARGVFLHGSFPDGLGALRNPFAIVAATDNRYLLRLDAR